ncbi:unnamed protein product, partial [Thlaspi arvense]
VFGKLRLISGDNLHYVTATATAPDVLGNRSKDRRTHHKKNVAYSLSLLSLSFTVERPSAFTCGEILPPHSDRDGTKVMSNLPLCSNPQVDIIHTPVLRHRHCRN